MRILSTVDIDVPHIMTPYIDTVGKAPKYYQTYQFILVIQFNSIVMAVLVSNLHHAFLHYHSTLAIATFT